MGVGPGVLESLAHAVINRGGVAPHDVDVVGGNPLLGEFGAQGGIGEAGLEVVLARDGGVDLLSGGEVGGVLLRRGRELHAADEADALRLGHETGDDAGQRARLDEVRQHGLDVVEVLVIAHLGLWVGVGDEEVDVGVLVCRAGDDLCPVGGKLVAVADDEVDVLVDVGLGGGGGVRVRRVLLGLEHLPVGVLVDGTLEGLVVALVPAAVGGDAAHDHGDLVLLVAGVSGGGGRAVARAAAAGQRHGQGSRPAKAKGLTPVKHDSGLGLLGLTHVGLSFPTRPGAPMRPPSRAKHYDYLIPSFKEADTSHLAMAGNLTCPPWHRNASETRGSTAGRSPWGRRAWSQRR